jgi:hypothetical protein
VVQHINRILVVSTPPRRRPPQWEENSVHIDFPEEPFHQNQWGLRSVAASILGMIMII